MLHTSIRPDAIATDPIAERALPPPIESVDRQFRSARAEVLWRTAPTLSGVVLLATGLAAWFLRESARVGTICTWVMLVAVGVTLLCRERRAAVSLGDRELEKAEGWTAAQTSALALVWLSLPASVFVGQVASVQATIAGLVCLLMASGVLLVILPAAAVCWSGLLGVALIGMLVADGGWSALPYCTLVTAYLAALFTGAAHASRLVRAHVGVSGEVHSRCRSVELLLAEVEDQGNGLLWQTDANNQLTYVSPRFAALCGLGRSQAMTVSLPALLGGDARLGEALLGRGRFSDIEVELRDGAGQSRWVSLSGSPIIDADKRFHGYRGIGADVTEWRQSQARLTRLASSDVLTGLPNRQRVRELIGQALDRAAADGRSCALLFMDLDGFKPVNDSFGHARGDQVLRAVAERLVHEVGAQGTVGRLGGDEFAVVLPKAENRTVVQQLGERLIDAIARPYEANGTQVRIGMSVGCAFGPLDAQNVDELVGRADLALYNAKSLGRGSFRHFDSKLQREADDRRAFEDDLTHALARNQFQLHYQPLVNTETREVTGFEALLRWTHPVRGGVSPAVFIPMAEELGLINAIGDWVIRTATRDASTWPDHVRVAVNVSACQLYTETLPNTIAEALAKAKMPANRLEVEVTESVFLGDSDNVLDVLRRVRGLGCGIALDDFGTGYSSLGYLNKTIFHKLKIDGSFVRDAAKRQETVAIIRAIVAIANSFRMTITAEGVERTEDFVRMRDLGCHQIQGYLFGKPMPYEKTLELVGTRWDRARVAEAG